MSYQKVALVLVIACAIAGCHSYAGQNGLPSASVLSAFQTQTASAAPGFQRLYTFPVTGLNGDAPVAPLASSIGLLYGVATGGGKCCGTVFSLDPASKKLSVFHRFVNQGKLQWPTGVVAVNGMLYGAAGLYMPTFKLYGGIFAINLSTHRETVLYLFKGGNDGANPQAAPIFVNGTLYGTTEYGGNVGPSCANLGCGTIYAIDLASGRERILYRFKGSADGHFPVAALLQRAGILYGVTQAGENAFSFTIATRTLRPLYSFQGGSDGRVPTGALVWLNGLLYGTAAFGGTANSGRCPGGCGVIFSLNPVSGRERIAYSFSGGLDSGDPAGVTVSGGSLYGTTLGGLTVNSPAPGTIFRFNPATGIKTIYHRFSFSNRRMGGTPSGAPTALNGLIYGATVDGGASTACATLPSHTGCGTLYTVRP